MTQDLVGTTEARFSKDYLRVRAWFLQRWLPYCAGRPPQLDELADLRDLLTDFLGEERDGVKVRVRPKWCSKPCCRGKPVGEKKHRAYAVAEYWSSTERKWRTIPKTKRTATTEEQVRAITALERKLGVDGELPRAPTTADLERILGALNP